MLHGYPVAATADNWLHDCLYQMLISTHQSLQADVEPPPWPDIIPATHRARLTNRTGIEDRLGKYTRALKRLSKANRDRVLSALENQNKISLLLSCACDCDVISNLPKPIQKPIKSLFEFSFKLLTDLGIRDNHYKIIYNTARKRVCPFCGCELFDAPTAPREALDHYLLERDYPFAAANLRNLVPMGNKCNSRYKLTQDILKRADGTRRRSFDPYGNVNVRISLGGSQPLEGNGGLPAWVIDIEPNSEEVTTWDEVFHIRKRYKRDVLDAFFEDWFLCFGTWFKGEKGVAPESDGELILAISQYTDALKRLNLTGHEFLRPIVFEMLHKHCIEGNQRLIDAMKDLVNGALAEAA